MAGQTIMQGFIGLSLPIKLRRLVTMAPALIIIALGVNPMYALIMSQVALSFALPFAIVPMLLITSRKDLMGSLVNKRSTKIAGWIITSVILALNAVLVYLTFNGSM